MSVLDHCFKLQPRGNAYSNCRLKKYRSKYVLQISNVELFRNVAFEQVDKSCCYKPPKGQASDPIRSLIESRRRARNAVIDIALSNCFTHMFTWTLDSDKVDRYDPDDLYRHLRSFLSNMSRRHGFQYVAIPEYHKQKDNEDRPAIHIHGLCNLGDINLSAAVNPHTGQYVVDGHGRQVFNFTSWGFGWSTCVKLDDNYERAAYYIVKYITKQESKIFGKWYLCSRDLQKRPAITHCENVVYGDYLDFDQQAAGYQKVVTAYRDVKLLISEFDSDGNILPLSKDKENDDYDIE